MNRTPLRAAATRLSGRFARTAISRRCIPWFVRHYGVQLEEAVVPPQGFATLQAFFTRSLRPGARPVDGRSGALASPADGRIGACGRIVSGTLVQAKGREYRLSELLGEPGERFHGGLYATIYLAPGDYHRFHGPVAGAVEEVRRMPGTFYSVNPASVAKVPNLFVRNERAVVRFEQAALVLVGACLVGGIRLRVQPGAVIQRGEELGWFEFGSTAIVLVEGGGWDLQVRAGARARVGEALAVRSQPRQEIGG